MADDTKRLGRGLSSLRSDLATSKLSDRLDTDAVATGAVATSTPTAALPVSTQGARPKFRIQMLRLSAIKPNHEQPRRQINDESIARLALSMQQNGVIQPIVVRPIPPHVASSLPSKSHSLSSKADQTPGPVVTEPAPVCYELIAGERRWRAAQAAQLSDVPAIIRDADDDQLLELALVENIQREDLNAIDRAAAYHLLRERTGMSAEDLGRRVGEDRTTVTNYLRLLELPSDIQTMVASDLITMGHARALLGLRDAGLQLKLAQAVVIDNLSVRALEDIVRNRRPDRARSSTGGSAIGDKTRAKRPHIRDLERQFEQALGTKVTIIENAAGRKGKITIRYNSLDDFDRVFQKLAT